MRCVHCGRDFSESEWKKNQSQGRWKSRNHDAKIKGFHINAFASAWASWESLCEKRDNAEKIGPEGLKTWINTVLGEPYEDKSYEVDTHSLEAHRIEYGAELPDDVLLLTCGVDTQDDRFELEVLGWGLNNKTWGIEYKVIYGSPEDNSTWTMLEDYLSRTWHYQDGSEIGLSITCIDSAGHYTDEVYKFCKTRLRKRIFPIIGRGAYGKPAVSNPSRNNRYRIPLFTLGVSTIKGILFSRLAVEKHTPGYCYFPAEAKNLKLVDEIIPALKVKNESQEYQAGVIHERERLRALDEISTLGNLELVNKAKYETYQTANEIALDLLKINARERDAVSVTANARVRETVDDCIKSVSELINKMRGY